MKHLIPNSIIIGAGLALMAGCGLGCMTATAKKTSPDGTTVEAKLSQLMWARKGLECAYTNGQLTLKVSESGASSNPVQDLTKLLEQANKLKP